MDSTWTAVVWRASHHSNVLEMINAKDQQVLIADLSNTTSPTTRPDGVDTPVPVSMVDN